MTKMTKKEENAQRVLRAEMALEGYRSGDIEDESHLRDLITDLLHLAGKKDMDPAQQLREAVLNFADETDSRDRSKEFSAISEVLYKLKQTNGEKDIPNRFQTPEKAGAFWDKNDSGNFEGQMSPANFDVKIPGFGEAIKKSLRRK